MVNLRYNIHLLNEHNFKALTLLKSYLNFSLINKCISKEGVK